MNMDEGPLWTMDSNLSEAVKLHQPRLRMVAIEASLDGDEQNPGRQKAWKRSATHE